LQPASLYRLVRRQRENEQQARFSASQVYGLFIYYRPPFLRIRQYRAKVNVLVDLSLGKASRGLDLKKIKQTNAKSGKLPKTYPFTAVFIPVVLNLKLIM
jgi:hypothetical protein